MNIRTFFKKRLFLTISLLITVFYVLFVANTNTRVVAASDFLNLYVGASLVRFGKGTLLYNPEANFSVQERVMKDTGWRNINIFRLLPFVAALFSPLTIFPVIDAFKIFALVNIFLLFIFVKLLKKEFKNLNYCNNLFFLLPFLYIPFLDNLIMGQTSFLLAFLLLVIYVLLKSGKSFLPGILSVLFLVKTQHIIITPFIFLLAEKKSKFLLGFLLSLLFIFAFSISVSGLDQILYYPKYLILTEMPDFGNRSSDFFTFRSILVNINIISVNKKAAFFINSIFYFVTLIIFNIKSKKLSLDTSIAIAAIFSLTFSMHALAFDLCILLPALFIFLDKAVSKSGIIIKYELFVAAILFLIPALSYIRKPYLASIIFLFIGYHYLFKKKILTGKFNSRSCI